MCSGLVQTLKTSARGAAKVRVIVRTRSGASVPESVSAVISLPSCVLRLQVDQRLAVLHVERDRDVLVRNHPPAVELPVADGHAYPHVHLFSVRLRSTYPVEALRE